MASCTIKYRNSRQLLRNWVKD